MSDTFTMPPEPDPVITDAQWTDATKTTIRATFNGVESFVPADEGNRHYRELLEWQAAGGTIAEPGPPPGDPGQTPA